MVVSTRLYDILGVDVNADDATIKKAYRKKAMKYHPDRHSNGSPEAKAAAEERFKEISGAYEVLSDERKRQIYNQLGDEGIKQAAAEAGMTDGPGINIADLLGNLFGMGGMPFGGMGGGPFAGMPFGGGRRRPNREKQDTAAELDITLEEAYLGGTRYVTRHWQKRCPSCNGRGCAKEDDITDCGACKGRGIQVQLRQMGPGMVVQQQRPCPVCSATGKRIKPGCECSTCNGRKVVVEEQQNEVQWPAGVRDGMPVRFQGEGNWEPDWDPSQPVGDLIFIIRIRYDKEHCPYRLEGPHLVLRKVISLCDALRGVDFGIKTIDGRILHIQSDQMLQTGDCLVVKYEGMPILEGPDAGSRGDLRIYVRVVYPKDRTVNKIADREKIKKTMQLLFREDPTTQELDGRFHDIIGIPVSKTNTSNDQSTMEIDIEIPEVEHVTAADDPTNNADPRDYDQYHEGPRGRMRSGPSGVHMGPGGMHECTHQ